MANKPKSEMIITLLENITRNPANVHGRANKKADTQTETHESELLSE